MHIEYLNCMLRRRGGQISVTRDGDVVHVCPTWGEAVDWVEQHFDTRREKVGYSRAIYHRDGDGS